MDFKDFENFVNKHQSFIYKPIALSSGRGVTIFRLNEFTSVRSLFEKIVSLGTGVIEELIEQVEEMKTLHPYSVNTIRVPTISIDSKSGTKEAYILSPILRVGQNKSCVDNGGSGGILSNIDKNTGVVYTDGADEFSNVYEKHPNTNIQFKGFEIPKWSEAVQLVNELVEVVPSFRYVGWDLALTDGGWVLVEANAAGGFQVLQIADKRGLKSELESVISDLL